MKMLLTGSNAVIISGLIITAIAWFSQNLVVRVVEFILRVLDETFRITAIKNFFIRLRGYRRPVHQDAQRDEAADPLVEMENRSSIDTSEDHSRNEEVEKPAYERYNRLRRCSVPIPAWIIKSVVGLYFLGALFMRPSKPYNYMSITLPSSMLDVFQSEADTCTEQRMIMHNDWPYPELIEKKKWTKPSKTSRGWAPAIDSKLARAYRKYTPKWFPQNPPSGFARWDPKRFKQGSLGNKTLENEWAKECPHVRFREPFYNPVDDPLKISNLETDVLEPLRGALDDGSVKIKHVVFILMESLRQEVWPIQQGSDIQNLILQANSEEDRDEVNEKLSHIAPHIEKITGVSGGFTSVNGSAYDPPELSWVDTAEPGFGGVNVVGALTGATMSTKSFCSNHCGTWALSVEKNDEADTMAYQPCVPQILHMLNTVKNSSAGSDPDDYRNMEWDSALFESMMEEYDRQDVFDRKIGWDKIFTRTQLKKGPYFDKKNPEYKQVNYFSYPETTLVPYLKEHIANVTASNKRMWLSHFTSTTHHAWDTPAYFNTTHYMPISGNNKWHKDFDKYLDTIRYHDSWMANIMNILEETGITNETLVVFAGDHGMAFKEDYHKTNTYEVPHISNFRVPITFRHPHLPRLQIEAKPSTISILPTVLDLLINSGSVNTKDTEILSDLVQDYQGQSLIRPFKSSENGRRAWRFSVVNAGAGMLSVSSADVNWRLIMPIQKVFEYIFTDIKNDAMELQPTSAWSIELLAESVGAKYGDDAAKWALEAEAVGRWWSLDNERLWAWHRGKV